MVQIDAELARKHYFDLEERFGKSVFEVTASFMQTHTLDAPMERFRMSGYVLLRRLS
jgi:hypothetical protein